MATFNQVKDDNGSDKIRCYVKGAAPAVLTRAVSARAAGRGVPADDELRRKCRADVARMENEGLRVMAAGYKDLPPAAFDPGADLLGYVTELEITAIVGMVDPPRAESLPAVKDAQLAHIRVRMITGDDVTTGAAIARKLGIDGEIALAFLVCYWDALHKLLGTAPLTVSQLLISIIPAVALLALREAGKLIARLRK